MDRYLRWLLRTYVLLYRTSSVKSSCLIDVPWRDRVIDHPIADMVYDGMLHLSDRPGLGVDLVEEEMEAHPGITENAPVNFYI